MIQLYHQTSFSISKKITNSYSTSFSLGIKAFAPEYRDAIYAIYSYVRLADEIVDSFHGYDKEALLLKFREDTYDAIKLGISTNPVIHTFQKIVYEYNIDIELIDSFLDSMERDLTNSSYGRKDYDDYIYGSAEVVGLMCLKIFVKGDNEKYDMLKFSAKKLGSAFQKVNFLRDIKSDLEERNRIYLPDVHNNTNITDFIKQKLEIEIEEDFKDALKGIKKLPIGVKLGVYSAYMYYYMLFNKIRSLNVDELLRRRIRISNFHKLVLLMKSIIEVKILKVT
ncbi:MAG: phytoene/squalene synthase family protein [Ignavibacteriaceae bacterium]